MQCTKAAVPLPPKTTDLTGRRCGRLVVSEWSYVKDGKRYWVCDCSCGAIVGLLHTSLRAGRRNSCGCLLMEVSAANGRKSATHRMMKTPEYISWKAMHGRCKETGTTTAKAYGERGISVCERWCGRGGFINFLADMGNKPSPEHSLDRINNNEGYYPENCRWATLIQQATNRRSTRLLTVGDRTQSMAEWAREMGMHKETLWQRLRMGWGVEEAVTTPVGGRRKCDA